MFFDPQRLRNFSFVIPGRLAGSAFPQNEAQLDYLWENGIRGIITLTESSLSQILADTASSSLARFEVCHIPVRDGTPPIPEDFRRALQFIDTLNEQNKAVLVHCAAGIGRTGSILAAYFIAKENLSSMEAVTKLRTMRPGSVETYSQELALIAFASELKK